MTNVTLMCETCNYIARRPLIDDPGARGVREARSEPAMCPNRHGPLVRQEPEMKEFQLREDQKRLGVQRDSRIEGVAVIWKDVLYTLPRPYRHAHLVQMIHEKTGDMNVYGDQGFVDQYGNFLRRKPALMVAERAGQIREDRPVYNELYSENVW